MAMSYISGDEVQKQHELIGKYKVIMGKVVPRGGEVVLTQCRLPCYFYLASAVSGFCLYGFVSFACGI